MATLIEMGSTGEPLAIAGRTLRSRLLVGTGKYRTNEQMVEAIGASGAEVVTVAVRRVDLDRTKEEGILHHLDLPQGEFIIARDSADLTWPIRLDHIRRIARADD